MSDKGIAGLQCCVGRLGGGGSTFYLLNERERISASTGWRGGGSKPGLLD